MDMLTSVLHGFLGWSLFGYYQRGKVDSENIASSFTIFDQLKSVTVNFSFPISVMRTSMVSVRRLDELFGYACPVEKNICKQYPYNKLSYRLTVDEEADFLLMNEIYKQLYKNAPIENKMIYEYLEKHQELLGINSKVKQKFL